MQFSFLVYKRGSPCLRQSYNWSFCPKNLRKRRCLEILTFAICAEVGFYAIYAKKLRAGIMREIDRDSCHFAGGLSFNGSVLKFDICIEATDMMISKKYINHDQLNEEKFVFLLVHEPNGGFMA